MWILIINLLIFFSMGYISKGSVAASIQRGQSWRRIYRGEGPSFPNEGKNMTVAQCSMRCARNITCKAFFHSAITSQCGLKDSFYHDPSEFSLSSLIDYYEAEPSAPVECFQDIDRFQVILLAANVRLEFRIFTEKLTHSKASDVCANTYGGHLVRIFTMSEHTFLKNLLYKCGVSGPFWIDGTNRYAANFSDINGWTTVSGQPIPLQTFWDVGEPKYPESRQCVHFKVNNGNLWEAKSCSSTLKYICEI